MRVIMSLFKTKCTTQVPGVSLLAKVDQLSSYDMIYVYHLLSVGSKLNLIQTERKLNGDLVYSVMFNTFKLGYITISNFSKIPERSISKGLNTPFFSIKKTFMKMTYYWEAFLNNPFSLTGRSFPASGKMIFLLRYWMKTIMPPGH